MSAEELAPGKYDLEKSENFDDYMKAIGVGMATRLIGNKVKPSQEIIIDNGKWTIKTVSTFKNGELSFTPGETIDETTADGRQVKSTFSINGNTLVQQQKGDPDCTIERAFEKDSYVMTLKVKDVVCKRYYKRTA